VALNETRRLRAYRVTRTGGMTCTPTITGSLRWIAPTSSTVWRGARLTAACVGELNHRFFNTGLRCAARGRGPTGRASPLIVEAYHRDSSTTQIAQHDAIASVLTPELEVDRFFVADRGDDVISSGMHRTAPAVPCGCALLHWRSTLAACAATLADTNSGLPMDIAPRLPGQHGATSKFVAVAERPTPRHRHQARPRTHRATRYTDFGARSHRRQVRRRDCYRKNRVSVDAYRRRDFGRSNVPRAAYYMPTRASQTHQPSLNWSCDRSNKQPPSFAPAHRVRSE